MWEKSYANVKEEMIDHNNIFLATVKKCLGSTIDLKNSVKLYQSGNTTNCGLP